MSPANQTEFTYTRQDYPVASNGFHKIAFQSSTFSSSPLRNILKTLSKNNPWTYYSWLNWVFKVVGSRAILALQHFKLWSITSQWKLADRIISVFYTEQLLDADGHHTTTTDLNTDSNNLNCIFCRPEFWGEWLAWKKDTCRQGKLNYGPLSSSGVT